MAKSSKARVAKRIAKKNSVPAAPEQKTKASETGKIKWNANAPLVRNAITFAVAQDTTVATAGVVGTASRVWDAIAKKQLSPDHAQNVLQAIENAKHRALVDARLAKGAAPDVSKSRVSEYRAIMGLATFRCVPALITTLLKIETLRVSHLYAITTWMAGAGAKKGQKRAANWKPEYTQAPPLATLTRIAHKANARNPKTKDGKKGSLAKAIANGDIVGFPKKDPKKGAQYLAKAIKLYTASNPELSATERPLLAAMLKNVERLTKEVAPRIVAARVKAAAKEAASE